MRHAILEKLGRHLTNNTVREADIVYLLVEIGKYLEARLGETTFAEVKKYPLLRFYRNWAVHAKLDDTKPANPLPDELQNASVYWLEREDTAFAKELVSKAITPERLRNELRKFLTANSLDRTLVEDDARWVDFLHALLSVLSDVPLLFSASPPLESFVFEETDEGLRWVMRARGQSLDEVVRWP